MKFEFRHESLKNKFSPILFVYGVINEWSKENRENIRENALIKQKKRKLGLKLFNPKFKH